MNHEVMRPPYEKGSYSQNCEELFDGSEEWINYDTGDDSTRDWVRREKQISDYPNRYSITEFGVNLGDEDYSYILHGMYLVASMSMEDDDFGVRTQNQWFVSFDQFTLEEKIDHISLPIDPLFFETDAAQNQRESIQFSIDSGLSVPNELDLLELTWVLDELKHGSQESNDC